MQYDVYYMGTMKQYALFDDYILWILTCNSEEILQFTTEFRWLFSETLIPLYNKKP